MIVDEDFARCVDFIAFYEGIFSKRCACRQEPIQISERETRKTSQIVMESLIRAEIDFANSKR